MQIKNKIIIIILIFIFQTINLYAEEFDITASEVLIDKKKNILIGKGYVEVIDDEGKILKV